MKILISFLFCFLVSFGCFAGKTLLITDDFHQQTLDSSVYITAEVEHDMTIEDILKRDAQEKGFFASFDKNKFSPKPNTVHWLRIELQNNADFHTEYILQIGGRFINYAEFYWIDSQGQIDLQKAGTLVKNSERNVKVNKNITRCAFYLPQYQKTSVYIKVWNIDYKKPDFAFSIISHEIFEEEIEERDTIQGIAQGMLWIMLVYNFLIFLMSKDKAHWFYSIYLFCSSVYFMNFYGFLDELVFPNAPQFSTDIYLLSTGCVPIFYLLFARNFIDTKNLVPFWDKVILLWIVLRILEIILMYSISHISYNFDLIHRFHRTFAFVEAFFFTILVFILYKKHKKSTYFLMVGTLFLNFGIVISIIWTKYSNYFFEAGVVLEILIFALGLGYRMKENEREKIRAQANLILEMQKNERLQKQINSELEEKVRERTMEIEAQSDFLQQLVDELHVKNTDLRSANIRLNSLNEEISSTLEKLRSTQLQLINAEKIASLGTLTASIAHEINNPLNYVLSGADVLIQNIQYIEKIIEEYEKVYRLPLPEIEDYKKQLQQVKKTLFFEDVIPDIYQTIEDVKEGANRTLLIVRNLQTFSHFQETEEKEVDIHNDIESTLIILRSQYLSKATIKKDFSPDIPKLYCNPSQINQAFAYLFQFIIKQIKTQSIIEIKTEIENENFFCMCVHCKNIILSSEMQSKLFEAEACIDMGLGIGLSIVQEVIQKHKGKIELQSGNEYGTTFKIRLPIQQDKKSLY